MADDELRAIFMRNLNHYMELAGYKQADLARYMKVSTTTTAKWCTGQTMPRIDKIQTICNWLGITKEDLLSDHAMPTQEYYLKKETRDIAEELLNNPGYKALFDAVRKMPAEDMAFVLDLVKRMSRNNEND